MQTAYPWYEIIAGQSLEQGDILEDFAVPQVSPDGQFSIPRIYNLIAMTQSCDIPDPELRHIIFCPVWTREELESVDSTLLGAGKIGHLAQYRVIGFYPIERCGLVGYERPWRVVQFYRIIEVRKEAVMDYLANDSSHLRLLSPYKEHMSQHFARFFMRVSLPVQIKLT